MTMPLYEQKCTKCHHESETMQNMNDEPPPCPKCGDKTKRQVGSGGFRLGKGAWEYNAYQGEGK